jgi:hypothetical protein
MSQKRSRKVSGALGRLEKKGFAKYDRARWKLTVAGRMGLELANALGME